MKVLLSLLLLCSLVGAAYLTLDSGGSSGPVGALVMTADTRAAADGLGGEAEVAPLPVAPSPARERDQVLVPAVSEPTQETKATAAARDLAIEVIVKEPSRILGSGGRPVRGIPVGLYRRSAPGDLVATENTGSKGIARFSRGLQPEAAVDGGDPLYARVLDLGVISEAKPLRRSSPRDGLETYRASLSFNRGWIQPVRVVDGEGKPASASIQVMEQRRSGLVPERQSSVRGRADGRLEVRVAERTEQRWVLVNGGNLGAAIAELRRPTEKERAIGLGTQVIQLSGENSIRGTAVDDKGAPATPFTIRATLQPRGGAGAFSGVEEPLRTSLLLRGEGHFQLHRKTSADGSFQLSGLLPGLYRLEAQALDRGRIGGSRRGLEWRALGVAVASTEPEPVLLVHSRPSLKVQVVQAEGGSSPNISLFRAGAPGEPRRLSGTSLGWAPASIDRYLYHNRSHLRRDEALPGWAGEIEVEGRQQYVLEAEWDDGRRVIQRTEVPDDRSTVDVVIVAPAKASLSQLNVEVSVAEVSSHFRELLGRRHPSLKGSPLRLRPTVEAAVSIEDVATGLPFAWEGRVVRGTETIEFPCSPGSYRIVASGNTSLDSHGSTVFPRVHGQVETVVDATSGQLLTIPVQLEVGGLLEVHLSGHVTAEEQLRWSEAARESKDSSVGRSPAASAPKVSLFLENKRRGVRAEVVRPILRFPERSGSAVRISNEWPLNGVETSCVLPSGSFVLRAELLDRAPVEVSVTIDSGDLTVVSISL